MTTYAKLRELQCWAVYMTQNSPKQNLAFDKEHLRRPSGQYFDKKVLCCYMSPFTINKADNGGFHGTDSTLTSLYQL
jgi:hypothetical protein